jgi:hypothetical protein
MAARLEMAGDAYSWLGLELAKASQVPLHLFFASKQDTFSESYVEFGDERRCISACFRC